MVRFAPTMYLCAQHVSDVSSFGWWLEDIFSDVTVKLPLVVSEHHATDFNSNLLTEEELVDPDNNEIGQTEHSVENFVKVEHFSDKRRLADAIRHSLPTGFQYETPRSRSTSPRLAQLPRHAHPVTHLVSNVHLIRSIEIDSEPHTSVLDSPREHFFKTVTEVNSRLRSLQLDNVQLFHQIGHLKQGFQELEADCDILLHNTKHLKKEIQDLRYLDDLILLLNGQVEKITLQQWPFAVANSHKEVEKPNLIV